MSPDQEVAEVGWGYRSAPLPAPPPDNRRARVFNALAISVLDIIAFWTFLGWTAAVVTVFASAVFVLIVSRRKS